MYNKSGINNNRDNWNHIETIQEVTTPIHSNTTQVYFILNCCLYMCVVLCCVVLCSTE
jgi:hypothetical protein